MTKYVDTTENAPYWPRSVLTREEWKELLEWEADTTAGTIEALEAEYGAPVDETILNMAFEKVFKQNFREATTKEIADWEAYNEKLDRIRQN